MEGVLAAFAQFDNDVRSERTRAGMRAALELGRWTFVAPLGYLNAPKWSGGSLVHDPERGSLVKQAFEDLASGLYSKQEVIARATAAGLRSRKGLALSPQSFGQMMRNPIYIGKLESAEFGVSTLGDFEPLIDDATFYRAQAVLDCRRRRRSEAAQPSGLPAPRFRPVRVVWSPAHRQLVEGAQRILRLLPLPTSVPAGQRAQG
jgi:site-specific DNA recombinase